MSGKLRTFGYLAWVPRTWPIAESPNGNRQRTVIVAAPSVAAALRAFASAGVHVTRSAFSNYGNADLGGIAEDVASSEPGAVFYQPKDFHPEYVKVPLTDAT